MSRDERLVPYEEQKQRKITELRKQAESRGFTTEYQKNVENEENEICHRKQAPATILKYNMIVEGWKM